MRLSSRLQGAILALVIPHPPLLTHDVSKCLGRAAGKPRAVALFRGGLAAAFLLCFLGVLLTTWRSAATTRRLGARAVESTALALATSVENALRAGKSGKELRSILSDRVVAYALIAGSDGAVRFHVNPDLVGTRLPASGQEALVAAGRPVLREVTLGLGTTAYAYDYPLGGGSSAETLRLVLHMGAIEEMGRDARQLWFTLGAVLALLAAAGVGLDRMFLHVLALRDEVNRRERLSLVGQMTATLAHEMRNALWGVKGYAQWLDEKLSPEHPGKRDVAAIVEGTGRIEGVVDDLLRFAREESYRLESFPVAPLIEEALSDAAFDWTGDVRRETDAAATVLADRDKLRRVLLNGIRNALDAMGEQGTLTVRTGLRARAVSVDIEDSGPGVAAEAVGRLFTPFFTTKVHGTGLGLAYSRKVVEGMAGTIELRNREKGAVLTVHLPPGEGP